MPVDFQVAFPQETIHLSQIRVLEGTPKTIEVIGEDFRAVETVSINGTDSPNVFIANKNRLTAQVPDAWLENDIVRVNVISRRITLSPRSVMRFRIGKQPGKTSGILRLLQLFLKVLFTSPGSDIFNKSLGAGGLRNVGEVFGAGNGADMLSSLVVAVDTAARQVIALQGRNAAIPLDERLLSAKITRSGFDRSSLTVYVEVEITTQAGQQAITNLEL
jgi:hypothetical protein